MSSISQNGATIGQLESVLRSGQFAVTAELSPPDSSAADDIYEKASVFDGFVDALNATDGSGANCHMSSIAVCSLLLRRGYETVMQVSCRDRNRIAIQGDMLGAAALGQRNVLIITGDGVQAGDHPEAKPVFDLDSISALGMVCSMRDEAKFLSGRKITNPPQLFVGAAANPFAPPLEFRPQRLMKKVEAGAQFVQTQYCFDVPMLGEYMQKVRDYDLHNRVFILVGVGPIRSARGAEWMRKNVAGVRIPDDLIRRLRGSRDQHGEGVRICVETIQQIKEIDGVCGIHLMAYRQEELVAQIIEESGVLGSRTPRCPGPGNC